MMKLLLWPVLAILLGTSACQVAFGGYARGYSVVCPSTMRGTAKAVMFSVAAEIARQTSGPFQLMVDSPDQSIGYIFVPTPMADLRNSVQFTFLPSEPRSYSVSVNTSSHDPSRFTLDVADQVEKAIGTSACPIFRSSVSHGSLSK
jgi:hypothetical protein